MTDDAFGAQWLLSMDYAVGEQRLHPRDDPQRHLLHRHAGLRHLRRSWGGVGAAITATSNHPGGVNVGFADGSVKFIKDSVNLQTWWALGSRNGGEVISADQY